MAAPSQGQSTATHVAFLRGINVGGHTVTNARLRELFEQDGFAGVWTYRASGNVAFAADRDDAADLEARIGALLGDALGYAVPAFVRDAASVRAIADHRPFPDVPAGGKVHIGFLRAPLDAPTRAELVALARDTDRVVFRGREIYWQVAGRFMDSALSDPAVDRLLADGWTLRTAGTVTGIAAKLAG